MTAAGPAFGLLGILLGALFGGLLSFFVLLAYNRVKTRSDNKEMRESMASCFTASSRQTPTRSTRTYKRAYGKGRQ